MILATVGGALGAYLVSHSQLNSRRWQQVSNASQAITEAVSRRAYYLEDVADMVGVHDDADEAEFSRYAHIRGRRKGAIVAVEWIRRSPSGKLVPPADIGDDPELVKPSDPANNKLGDAEANSTATPVIKEASLHKQVESRRRSSWPTAMPPSTWRSRSSPIASAATSRASSHRARSWVWSTRSDLSPRLYQAAGKPPLSSATG